MIIQALLDLYKSCTLCPRTCRLDRTKGELGYCRLPADIIMDCALAIMVKSLLFPERAALGQFFFLHAIWMHLLPKLSISHSAQGRHLTVLQLAKVMLDLQKMAVTI